MLLFHYLPFQAADLSWISCINSRQFHYFFMKLLSSNINFFSSQTSKMGSSQFLTDDCWEMVINHLDIQANQFQLDRLSLVSKQFLLVTNQLLQTLKVFDRTKLAFPAYLKRFPHIKMIDLSDFSGEIKTLFHDLAHSDMNLQGLDVSNKKALPLEDLKEIASTKKNFQILKCSRLSILRDAEVIAIGNAFPSLEELDISYLSYASAVTDQSIIVVSTKLSNLRKINLSGNVTISDESLKSISMNCAKLTEIILHHCGGVTQDGLVFLVKNSPTLAVLSLALPEDNPPTIHIPFSGLRFLSTLELFYMKVSDRLLFQLADAKMPLKKFALCHCKGFSFAGVIYFLHTYQSLESISLADVDFLSNIYISLFSKFFSRMTTIRLNCCPNLTDKAFCILLGACPRLENLEMAKTGLGDHNSQDLFGVNPKGESLNLSSNLLGGEDKMRKIVSFCPNLMYLDLSGCIYLNKGIITILESCNKIRHLKIIGCQDIMDVDGTSKFEKLEILQAGRSAMSDRSLSMFARRSPELRCLNLRFCQNITEEGVKEVVQNCPKLLEVNLRGCNIEPEFVNWIVNSRPQLRQIIPPSDLHRFSRQMNPFLRLTCPFCSI